MPLFTLQYQANGPIITAGVLASKQRAEALKAAGQPVPGPQLVRALVDTGASCTCVDPTHLEALGLSPTGTVQVHTPTPVEAPSQSYQYDVGMFIMADATEPPLVLDTLPVVASSLGQQGIDALIGRDILSRCVLVYNGKIGQFTLAF